MDNTYDWKTFISSFFPSINAVVLAICLIAIINLFLEIEECKDEKGCFHAHMKKTVCKSRHCLFFSVPLIVLSLLVLVFFCPPVRSRIGNRNNRIIFSVIALLMITSCAINLKFHLSKTKAVHIDDE